MFNDWHWVDARSMGQQVRFDDWKQTIAPADSLVVIEIGAGLAVPTIRLKSEESCVTHVNSRLIRINPREPDVPREQDIELRLGGLEALTLIDQCLQELK